MSWIVVWAGWMLIGDVVIPLDGGVSLHLLDGPSAQHALTDDQRDPFWESLSTIDVAARLGRPVDEAGRLQAIEELKGVFARSVMNWSPAEVAELTQTCRAISVQSQASCPGFVPRDWQFVKTDGSEELGAAYTRGPVVVLSAQKLKATGRALGRLVAHETCHVYARTHPQTRARLLERIGFRVVGTLDLGEALSAVRLTNPDSPAIDSVIAVRTADGVPFEAALVLRSKSPVFAPVYGRGVFRYLEFGLVAVAGDGKGGYRVAVPAGQTPMLMKPEEVTGFFEQVGRNTRYIMSPDEILAENVALHFSATEPADDPRIPEDLISIIATSTEAPVGVP